MSGCDEIPVEAGAGRGFPFSVRRKSGSGRMPGGFAPFSSLSTAPGVKAGGLFTRKLHVKTTLAAVVAALTISTTAHAQVQRMPFPIFCGKPDDLTTSLRQKYGERVIARGVNAERTLVELWRSDKGGFSITMKRMVNGQMVMCALIGGEFW